jgi:hypothetical protein
MPDGTDGGVTFTFEGAHLRVDARPARLVSMLRHGDGPPVVTAQPSSGPAKVEDLPAAARQATFQVRDDITVEATHAATFVAVADESGRCLVISYGGELTVVPGGGSDRFALAADEALVIGGTGADPAVVPVADLSADAHPQVAALLDATTDALFSPAGAPAAPTDTTSEAVAAPEERTVEVAPTSDDKPADGTAKKAGPQKPGGAKKAAATGGAAAAAGPGGGGRRKKGKKGRPQPQKAGGAKKAAATPGAAAGAAGGAAAAAGGAKKVPAKAAGGGGKQPPKQPAKTGGGGGGGGGGDDGHGDDSYEDTPRDRRFLVGAVLVALVLAVGAVLLLSQVGDDSTEVATGATTTTVEDEDVADTTTSSTTPETTTTAPASTTTTARATTTTQQSTTTTARATTTTAPEPKYSIEPKSCVQNGNTITYTASVTNEAATAYDFTVDVSFKTSDGTEVAKGTATVSSLGSGRTAEFRASGTSSRTLAGTGASCDVTRVDARPSA